ncbi:MAG: glycosyltransferase [Bacteroidetes bacterium]|nr:glycosyltransferase [Bacteroidota bacterium]
MVQNGFDPEDVAAVTAAPPADRFMLTHVGSLYASRNPVGLWRALSRLRGQGAIPRLRLRLVGSVAPSVHEALAHHGLTGITTHVPYVPHEDAVAAMQRAHLLLLSIEAFRYDDGMITGKLYEYLASGRPVLGLGPPSGDAADLLQRTGGGQIWARDDVDAIAADVLEHYAAWEAGTPRAGAPADALTPLTRQAQTGILAEVLDDAAAMQTVRSGGGA